MSWCQWCDEVQWRAGENRGGERWDEAERGRGGRKREIEKKNTKRR